MISMTPSLALRVEKSELDHFLSWIMFLGDLEANPFGIEIQRSGGTVALFNQQGTLGPLLNRALGFSEEDLPELSKIFAGWVARQRFCKPGWLTRSRKTAISSSLNRAWEPRAKITWNDSA